MFRQHVNYGEETLLFDLSDNKTPERRHEVQALT